MRYSIPFLVFGESNINSVIANAGGVECSPDYDSARIICTSQFGGVGQTIKSRK